MLSYVRVMSVPLPAASPFCPLLVASILQKEILKNLQVNSTGSLLHTIHKSELQLNKILNVQ